MGNLCYYFWFKHRFDDPIERRLILSETNDDYGDIISFDEYIEIYSGNIVYTKIYVPNVDNIKGGIFYCQGFGDHNNAFHDIDFILKFCKLGYVIFSHDNIGSGKSDGLWWYIDHFMDTIVKSSIHVFEYQFNKYGSKYRIDSNNSFLLGYSMGGNTAINISLLKPNMFKGMLLAAPMVGISETVYAYIYIYMFAFVCYVWFKYSYI